MPSNVKHLQARQLGTVVAQKLDNFFARLLEGEKLPDRAGVIIGRFAMGEVSYKVTLVVEREEDSKCVTGSKNS